MLKQLALEGLRQELDEMGALVRQVMKQTRARIFRGNTRNEGKLLSLFEPSTEVIRPARFPRRRRISVVKRRHGLARCRYKGLIGMNRWVGLGIIADNIVNLGRAMEKRASRRSLSILDSAGIAAAVVKHRLRMNMGC